MAAVPTHPPPLPASAATPAEERADPTPAVTTAKTTDSTIPRISPKRPFLLLLASCTSNTIYKKPKDLIPKDSMVALLTDMYIASSAKNRKNKFLKKEKNYVVLVYEKYKN